jgi:hypothetical protein
MRLTKKIRLLLGEWARWACGPRGIDKNALPMPIHVVHMDGHFFPERWA